MLYVLDIGEVHQGEYRKISNARSARDEDGTVDKDIS